MPVLKKSVHLAELLLQLHAAQSFKVLGSQDIIIDAVEDIEHAAPSALVVLHKTSYKRFLPTSKASVCITSEWAIPYAPPCMTLLLSDNPYYLFAEVLRLLYPQKPCLSYVADTAYIHPDSRIGQDCYIAHGAYIGEGVHIDDRVYVGPQAVLEKNCTIGSDCRIEAGAVLRHTELGKRVSIHSGARLGQEGFGFAIGEEHLDIPHLGKVVVGDDVSIGANTCIDRGSVRDTIISRGTRIDNLVQIGHNCQIGEYCILAGQVGLAGSTVLESRVTMGGKAGSSGHLTIGEHSHVLVSSTVMGDIPPRTRVAGCPAVLDTLWHRQIKALRRLLRAG